MADAEEAVQVAEAYRSYDRKRVFVKAGLATVNDDIPEVGVNRVPISGVLLRLAGHSEFTDEQWDRLCVCGYTCQLHTKVRAIVLSGVPCAAQLAKVVGLTSKLR